MAECILSGSLQARGPSSRIRSPGFVEQIRALGPKSASGRGELGANAKVMVSRAAADRDLGTIAASVNVCGSSGGGAHRTGSVSNG